MRSNTTEWRRLTISLAPGERLPGLGEVTAARLVAALALPLRRDVMGTVPVYTPADLVPVFARSWPASGLSGSSMPCATAACGSGPFVR